MDEESKEEKELKAKIERQQKEVAEAEAKLK